MLTLTTRPRGLNEPLHTELLAMGFQPHNENVLEITPVEWPTQSLFRMAALVVTSANGAFELGKVPHAPREMPVFAVGIATAACLKRFGFINVYHADGTAADLLRLVMHKMPPGSGPILHVGGLHLSLDMAAALRSQGYEAIRAIVYEAAGRARLSAGTEQHLRRHKIGAVVLMSKRTAEIFGALVRKSDLVPSLARIEAFVMSPAIAAVLDAAKWRRIHIAAAPSRAALTDLLGCEAARIAL